jgi:hypothetical protein
MNPAVFLQDHASATEEYKFAKGYRNTPFWWGEPQPRDEALNEIVVSRSAPNLNQGEDGKMTKRSFNGLFKCLGAVSVALIAAGCSSGMNESAEPTTSQSEELGESFSSCVAANNTTDWVNGTLTIDATANTTGTIIVSPGNGVVKVNGRTCKTSAGATIALTAVKFIQVNGKSASSDTFVLDFSAGLPKAPLLQSAGIVIDGGETVASTKTPDTVVIKGSTGVDPVSVGLDPAADGTVDVSLTATAKVSNLVLKRLGQKAQGPFQPQLIFSLGTGDDTFTGLGGFPAGAASTAVDYGMSIYGGAGNDTIIGGLGADKINGGGQATDTLDYTGRSGSVFVDMDSTKVTAWGGDLRGVTMGTETVVINGTTITFANEKTPAAIAAKINAGIAGIASIVGNRLRLTATGSSIVVDGGTSLGAVKLGLTGGLYEALGNDGTPGTQVSVPWTAASTAWSTSQTWKVGDYIVPSAANGYWYKATVAGAGSTTTEPTWPTTVGSTVADGAATWKCMGRVLASSTAYNIGDVLFDVAHNAAYRVAVGSGSSLATFNATAGQTQADGGVTWTTLGGAWAATTAFALNDYVVKANGDYFKATAAGTTAGTQPAWPTAVGGVVVDGTVTWKYMGKAKILTVNTEYAVGDIAVDVANVRLGQAANTSTRTTGAGAAYPNSPATFTSGQALLVNMGAPAEGDDVQGVSIINAGTGNDVLVGNVLANTLNGNDGDDVLSGGPALTVSAQCPMDKLNGGNGNDWFDMGVDDNIAALTKTDCNQTVAGGAGTDVVDYSQRTANGKLLVKLDGTTLSGEQTTVPKEGDKIANDIEILLSGAGDDSLTGTDNGDFLFGGKGKDAVFGGKGDDHIYGGPGDDSLYGDVGDDTFYELNAYPAATAWNEPLAALAGAPFAGVGLAIYGADVPAGGDDLVFGGGLLTESNKVDFTDAANPVKVAICSDGAATNTNMGSCTSAKSDYVGNSFDGSSTSGSGTLNSFINIEYVAGSLTAANTFIGSSNAETFEGGSGVDTILGQGGQDTLFGYPDPATGRGVDNTSADILCGGDDDDVLQAGTAATTAGEGQMDQAKSGPNQVQLSGASQQAPNYCTHWSTTQTVNPSTVITGVNLCFGGGTKYECAN